MTPVADLVDDARYLAPGGLGQLAGHRPSAHLVIDGVDPDGAHGDADLSRTGMWIGEVHQPEHLGAAVLAELDRLHRHAFRFDVTALKLGS